MRPTVTIARRYLLIAIPLALFIPMAAGLAADGSWDGTWTGLLNNKAPIAVTIANGKVVSYTIKGAPFDVQYSNITPMTVSFGDHDHLGVELTRTGDRTASETVHGRGGFGKAVLTKQ
jgi:hypothetical protein